MNRDTNLNQEKSKELIASLFKLRDVLKGFEDPHVLQELLRFEGAKELFGAFSAVYATAENPSSPLIAGNFMNDGQPVQFGSWHEYGFSLLRSFQLAYSEPDLFKFSEGEPNGLPIHTVTVQIRREMAFALLEGFQVGFDEPSNIKNKKPTLNQLMAEELVNNPLAAEWTQKEWQDNLPPNPATGKPYSLGSIKGTLTWRACKSQRDLRDARADSAAADKRRGPTGRKYR